VTLSTRENRLCSSWARTLSVRVGQLHGIGAFVDSAERDRRDFGKIPPHASGQLFPISPLPNPM
jgi:hypothetical protein